MEDFSGTDLSGTDLAGADLAETDLSGTDLAAEDGSRRTPRQKSPPARSGALWIGFTGLLLLMAMVALDSERSVRTLTVNSAALRNEVRARDALLDQLRADIHQSGTVLRDYLVELENVPAQT